MSTLFEALGKSSVREAIYDPPDGKRQAVVMSDCCPAHEFTLTVLELGTIETGCWFLTNANELGVRLVALDIPEWEGWEPIEPRETWRSLTLETIAQASSTTRKKQTK